MLTHAGTMSNERAEELTRNAVLKKKNGSVLSRQDLESTARSERMINLSEGALGETGTSVRIVRQNFLDLLRDNENKKSISHFLQASGKKEQRNK
ncbi:hypothetical protein EVAR_64759_1 [Eumeta japonica]|uniref:Uncharacterized protein n=1 Tax=Eumeta variegata TaxID=151549 RepID=A0A4C1Z9K0_EUMVA|nr:hypothetical protein EVAR_64759_1 [Eumeta japonica]